MNRIEQSDNGARHIMWMSVMVSIVFAIVFSIIVGFLVNRIGEISKENKQNAHELCLNANKNRADVIDVWEFFFTLNSNPSPLQLANITAAREKVTSVYKQQECP